MYVCMPQNCFLSISKEHTETLFDRLFFGETTNNIVAKPCWFQSIPKSSKRASPNHKSLRIIIPKSSHPMTALSFPDTKET